MPLDGLCCCCSGLWNEMENCWTAPQYCCEKKIEMKKKKNCHSKNRHFKIIHISFNGICQGLKWLFFSTVLKICFIDCVWLCTVLHLLNSIEFLSIFSAYLQAAVLWWWLLLQPFLWLINVNKFWVFKNKFKFI